MTDIYITEDQRDCYQELSNVAMGQALVDEMIDLSGLNITFADLTIEATVNSGSLIYITADGPANNSIEVLFRGVSEFTEDDFSFF